MRDTPPHGIDRPDLREAREEREGLELQKYVASEKGDAKEKNEDAYVVGEDYAAVFDGMGGPYGGDIASSLARDSFRALMETLDPPESVEGAREQVENMVRQIQDRIVEKKNAFFRDEFEKYKDEGGELSSSQFLKSLIKEEGNILNMGTTGVVTRFLKDDDVLHAVVASVGDSRGYLAIKAYNNKLKSVTLDHSKMSLQRSDKDAWDLQKAFDRLQTKEQLPKSMKSLYYERNKLVESFGRCAPVGGELRINHETFNPRIYDIEIDNEDSLLLTTDGIHDNLTRAEMERTFDDALEQGLDPAEALVRNAKIRSRDDEDDFRAKDDDMTAVVITPEGAEKG